MMCLTRLHKLVEAAKFWGSQVVCLVEQCPPPGSCEFATSLFRYDQVRLLAPIAELRMLVAGLSGFINPQSLA